MAEELAPEGKVRILCHVGIKHPTAGSEVPSTFVAQGIASADVKKIVGTLENATAGVVATVLQPSSVTGYLWLVTCTGVTAPAGADVTLRIKGYKDLACTQIGDNQPVTFKVTGADQRLTTLEIQYPKATDPLATVATSFAAYGTFNSSTAHPAAGCLGSCQLEGVTPVPNPIHDFFNINPGPANGGFWVAAFTGLVPNTKAPANPATYKLRVAYGDPLSTDTRDIETE